jgi:uncharacterized protein with ATP-grasp and redox domains
MERCGLDTEQCLAASRQVLRLLAEADYAQPPPRIAQPIIEAVAAAAGREDPYLEIKAAHNAMAQAMLPPLRQRLRQAADPLRTAVKVALAGNIIDFGQSRAFDLERTLEETLATEPALDEIDRLRRAMASASQLLYLADNAGEIVFDGLLLEQMPQSLEITVAVRGGPALNDALLDDARAAGLPRRVRIIDSGLALSGSWIERSGPQLQRAFASADLIISKGQGNFETLLDQHERPLFFLFLVKCSVVAQRTGLAQGSAVVAHVSSLARSSP